MAWSLIILAQLSPDNLDLGENVDIEPAVNIFMPQNMIQPATAFLLDAQRWPARAKPSKARCLELNLIQALSRLLRIQVGFAFWELDSTFANWIRLFANWIWLLRIGLNFGNWTRLFGIGLDFGNWTRLLLIGFAFLLIGFDFLRIGVDFCVLDSTWTCLCELDSTLWIWLAFCETR